MNHKIRHRAAKIIKELESIQETLGGLRLSLIKIEDDIKELKALNENEE